MVSGGHNRSSANETTGQVLDFFLDEKYMAFRQNVLPIPTKNGGVRPGGKRGQPDIVAIVPVGGLGVYCGVEVKHGKDRMSEYQLAFHSQAKSMGAIMMVIKDFNDFLTQWRELKRKLPIEKRR